MAAAITTPDEKEPQKLPLLRHDIILEYAGEDSHGHPLWHLFDPAANKFFRISYAGWQILRRWKNCTDAVQLAAQVNRETALDISENHVTSLINFLQANNLNQKHSASDVESLNSQAKRMKISVITRMVHQYLFFKIPLVKPDNFLDNTLPYVRWIGSRAFIFLVLLMGIIGIYLISRQFDVFIHHLVSLFSFNEIFYYILALVLAKIAHELGHAYVTKATGNKVATMGIAFLVMFPVLYTDTTSVWRIRNKHKRMQIAAAGMAVELGIALICLFIWSFLPNGALRSAVFLLATTTWVLTLAINLNPLMRFDGYYLLQDWLDVDNLQTRGFAHAKWYLREKLFGLNRPMPEPVSLKQHRWLIVYSYMTWIYRFFLFIGIALLVYYFFFKILGIFLFFVEIIWFILLPVYREIKEWWKLRNEVGINMKSVRTLLIVLAVTGFFVFPLRHDINLDAVLGAERQTVIFSRSPGIIAALNVVNGQKVNKGEILAIINDEQLGFELATTAYDIAATKISMEGGQTEDIKERNKMQVMNEELAMLSQKYSGLKQIKRENLLTAPFAGIVTDVRNDLRAGTWIGRDEEMMRLLAPGSAKITAFLTAADLHHIKAGDEGKFYPDVLAYKPVTVKVKSISTGNTTSLNVLSLASVYGGNIAVRAGENESLIPEQSIYEVMLEPLQKLNAQTIRETRGVVVLKGRRESLAMRTWKHIAAVFIRESGF